jgi:tRNA (cytidine/uridine-2'-O-)-methyltransferase
MFNIVLVEPEIPPNTGNIARLCLATGSTLHLIKPLGFSLSDRELKRAGLDYWAEVKVVVWESMQELFAAPDAGRGRSFFLTTKCARAYYEEAFQPGDFLFFGRESRGLPESLLAENPSRLLTIPMRPETRSLNLATAVAIVLFEGMRQLRQDNRS